MKSQMALKKRSNVALPSFAMQSQKPPQMPKLFHEALTEDMALKF